MSLRKINADIVAALNQLGIADRTGCLRPGLDADIVVLDGDLRPLKVSRRGEWVAEVGTATLKA